MNLSKRLIAICEEVYNAEELSRNKIFLKKRDDKFIIDSSLADSEHNSLIINTINDFIEGGNWNQLSVKPSDNTYITTYQASSGKVKEYKSNQKKFPDTFEFEDESDAREFFDTISVDIEEEEVTTETKDSIEFNDEGTPEEFADIPPTNAEELEANL